MFATERLDEIVKTLHKEGKVVVKELSNRFNVSEDCIRKDLRALENQNLLERTYGGAVLLRKSAPNENIEMRKDRDIDAKRKIAKKAFELIKDYETIFLDISTINILLAEAICSSNKKVTVITNMIDIVKAFSHNSITKIICTGGTFNNDLDGFVGAAAIDNISKYKVNRAFIGSCGVDVFDGSITTFDIEDGSTKRAIMEAGKETYLVMENKKFLIDGVYKFASLQDVDAIITEEKPAEDVLKVLLENDTSII